MRSLLSLLALFALLLTASAMRNGCENAVKDESGNYYCEPAVETIRYVNISGSGTYQTPSLIEGAGSCVEFVDIPYGGPLAPYNEEITIILRGPLKLRQFAAYSLDVSCQQSGKHGDADADEHDDDDDDDGEHEHHHHHHHRSRHHAHHAHQSLHDDAEKKKRGLGDVVVAEIDGQLVSWINTYGGPPAPEAPDANSPTTSPLSSSSSEPSSSTPPKSGASGSCDVWERISFYNSEERVKEGLTFLTHPSYANAIAFAGPDGKTAVEEPTLFDGELENTEEMFIQTDKSCSEDVGTECPYYKEGDKAYHGYGGINKAFFFEFMMPDTGSHASVLEMESKYKADNMPAIWSLNSRIMTNQYGCNCHLSGCGEIDFFEVLNPGNHRMKSTIHGKTGFSGGDSHYIRRPTDSWMSAWVVFDGDKMVLKVVDPNTEAPESLTADHLSSIMGSDEEFNINIEGKLAIFEVSSGQ